MGAGVVRVDPDDVQLRKIPEIDGIEAGQLAAENKVEELLAGQVGHGDGVLLTKRNRVSERGCPVQALMAPIARGCNRDATATISPWRVAVCCRREGFRRNRSGRRRPRANQVSGRDIPVMGVGRDQAHIDGAVGDPGEASAREGTFGRCSIGPALRANQSTSGLGPATRASSRSVPDTCSLSLLRQAPPPSFAS